jgi:hypothetical protein
MPSSAPSLSDIALYLALLADIPARLRAAAAGRSDADLARAPTPKAWSPAEVLGHLRGCEQVWTGTIYAMLAEKEPALARLDPRRIAKAACYAELPFRQSVATFGQRRAELLHVLGALRSADWDRGALIAGRRHTVFTQARRLALHERVHCDELAALLADRDGRG